MKAKKQFRKLTEEELEKVVAGGTETDVVRARYSVLLKETEVEIQRKEVDFCSICD